MRVVQSIFVFAYLLITSAVYAVSINENKAANYFDSIKKDPELLSSFLKAFPKGADIHTHISGASFSENLISYASPSENLCVDLQTFAVSTNANCPLSQQLNSMSTNQALLDNLIDAWSMRHFSSNKESGHDHFFATFGKFNAITHTHRGDILAEMADRAALQNEIYLEVMVAPDDKAAINLSKKIGCIANNDYDAMRQKLLQAKLDEVITLISKNADHDEDVMRNKMQCDSANPHAGCNIKMRYLYQVSREQEPCAVFAQLLAGFEVAVKDTRFVGVNMVQPEDGKIAMRDYSLHMQMVRYLHSLYPQVKFSLHAGELNKELIEKDTSGDAFLAHTHMLNALTIASPNRIGHGVDIFYEYNIGLIVSAMQKHATLVEVNLTSNEDVLNIQGKSHPLPFYLQHHIPVTLSTDDEGVTRSLLSDEYVKAASTYNLSYLQLKNLARNSIHYAFLPGESLWTNHDYASYVPVCAKETDDCQVFLNRNEKANMEWKLEKRFMEFENRYQS